MRLSGLDGLRTVSIVLVLVAHLADGQWWAPYGGFGVEVFFTISGFLITWLLCLLEDEKAGKISLTRFYIRRALRILPPAFLFLAGVSVLSVYHLADVRPGDILYSAGFVRNLFGTGEHTGHFWSLAIEEQFYLIWPTIFLLAATNRRRLLLISGLILLFPPWFYFRAHHGANSMAFDVRCIYLLMGCGLALAWREKRLAGWLSSRWSRHYAVPILAAAVICFMNSPYSRVGSLVGIVDAAAVAATINYAIQQRGRILDARPMVWVGQLSYSLYLWQQIFCWRSGIPGFGGFPVNVAAAMTLAVGSYYLVEKPALRLRDRLLRVRHHSQRQQGQLTGAGSHAPLQRFL